MLIGICGLAGSGKDTSGDVLVKGFEFVKVAFADPLKRIAMDVYEFTEDQLWGPSEMRNAPDKRYPRKHGPFKSDKCLCCGIDCGGEGMRALASHMEKFPQCYLTPRHALQQLGTEWGRDCFDSTWVDYAVRTYQKLQRGDVYYDRVSGLRTMSFVGNGTRAKSDVVITDVRFINEVNGLRSHGAKLVRVVRRQSGLEGVRATHRSETEQAEMKDALFDQVIINDGTLDDLKSRMVEFMRTIT